MNQTSSGNLKLHSFDLGDADRAAIVKIRERLQLNSGALAVRIALRRLAQQLDADHPQEAKQNE